MASRHTDEIWQRTIIESLRPIDPNALFWVDILEFDNGEAPDDELASFPTQALIDFVDTWLAGLDGEQAERIWEGRGVRLRLQARRRSANARGWHDMPSLSLLEQQMADLEFDDGSRRPFVSLRLDEVDRLGRSELRLVRHNEDIADWFQRLAGEMRHFGHETVGDMHPNVITTYAGIFGLVAPPP